MKKILYLLGFIWAIPLSLPIWILGLFLLVTRQIDHFKVTNTFEFIWDLKESGYFFKAVFEDRGFWGFGFGNNIMVKDQNDLRYIKGLLHESRHCMQSYVLGIFFPILYIFDSFIIYLFRLDCHPYYDNWFEIDARKFAGQLVHIPKFKWQTDRWFFW